jgi:hypothetical protein
MPMLLLLVAVLVVFGAYSWFRHVSEREALALLREENELVALQARVHQLATTSRAG